ncbi:MAG TPA: type II secretion system inner membrane protein GspF [Candidatus Dormibacteraeota bacterium]|nr:type II secretion system inner membrane protein GspF [Candidatus Dormibacteraeota bacterium]
MPVYAYKGLNEKGRNVGGIVDADSPKNARLKLRRSGIFPTELNETRDQSARDAAGGGSFRLGGFSINLGSLFERSITPQDLALITRQLATLVGAGLPLVDCLGALIEQVDSPRQKKVLSQVRELVVEGGTLADAMKQHPAVFNDLYVNMVRAGEASGALDIVLIRLAEYTERAAALRGKVRSALTYPVFMGMASMGILFFLLSYVVPKVTRIFEERNAKLPTLTIVLLAISGFLSTYWWAILAVVVIAVIAVRVSTRTPAGRLRFDALTLRIPYFGKVLKKVALARFARTLSTLLLGGIPLLQALDIVKHVVSNMVLSNAIEDGRNSIREGHSVADPLKKSGLFPPLLVHMIAVGEKSGELEQMLSRAADAYDGEVEASVSALSSIMEPVLVIFMGGVVLFIVLAILLPIFDLNQLVK